MWGSNYILNSYSVSKLSNKRRNRDLLGVCRAPMHAYSGVYAGGMSALATSDCVAALRIGPGAPGGKTGATSDGVTPGWNRIPESCCAGDGEAEAVPLEGPCLPERVARVLEFRTALEILGRSWTVECGEGVGEGRACDDTSGSRWVPSEPESVPEPLTLCVVEPDSCIDPLPGVDAGPAVNGT